MVVGWGEAGAARKTAFHRHRWSVVASHYVHAKAVVPMHERRAPATPWGKACVYVVWCCLSQPAARRQRTHVCACTEFGSGSSPHGRRAPQVGCKACALPPWSHRPRTQLTHDEYHHRLLHALATRAGHAGHAAAVAGVSTGTGPRLTTNSGRCCRVVFHRVPGVCVTGGAKIGAFFWGVPSRPPARRHAGQAYAAQRSSRRLCQRRALHVDADKRPPGAKQCGRQAAYTSGEGGTASTATELQGLGE